MPTVLFLCSGNYYRSRFAEIYFNWLAAGRGLAWQADSRGLALDPYNSGALSAHAREGLARLKIALPEPLRFPRPVTENDLSAAQHVVAVKEAEHRPLMARHFPGWLDRIEYWHVHDLDCAGPEEALPVLERHIVALANRLGGR